MSTQVLQRASVECYDCGKAHQIRHVDRGPGFPGERQAVYSGRQKILLPTVDHYEMFGLVVALVTEFANKQAQCPISENRHSAR
jgi:hypothetical protein